MDCRRKRRRSGCQPNSALPVRSAAGLPTAETNSTFGTSVRRECSSRNRMTFGAAWYMNAEPKEPGNRRPSARTRLMRASPSICAPPRKNTSMRPWPARSNSSREPSVKGLPVRFCNREILKEAFLSRRRKAPAAGIGDAAPIATWRASPMRRAIVQASSSSRANGTLRRAPANQCQELLARRQMIAEHAEHRGRHHGRVLLLHPAHHHAEVARLDHDRDALRVDRLHDDLRDLLGEPLLELQAARVEIDEPRELAYAEHLAVRQVADVAAAEERQHVVLAHAVDLDVLHDDHAAGVLREERVVDHLRRLGAVAVGEEAQRLG